MQPHYHSTTYAAIHLYMIALKNYTPYIKIEMKPKVLLEINRPLYRSVQFLSFNPIVSFRSAASIEQLYQL